MSALPAHILTQVKRYLRIYSFHSGAIIGACIVGMLCSLPQFGFIQTLNSEYAGIYMLKSDAETHYLARMKNSAEGNGIGNPFFSEYSHEPSATWSYAEWLLSLPNRFFDITIPEINLLYKFILPALATLCAYYCLFLLTKNRAWSCIGSITIISASALVNSTDILNLINWNTVYTQFLAYSRPINPQFSGIIFFAYIISCIRTLKQPSKFNFILLGCTSIISWYTYFYTATFIFTLNILITLRYGVHNVLLKNFPTKKITLFLEKISAYKNNDSTAHNISQSFWYALVTTLITICGGLPFILATHSLTSSPFYPDLAHTANIVSSHAPVLSSAWIITGLFFILTIWIYSKKDSEHRYPDFTLFFILILCATGIVVNQQIITGIIVQQGHYHWYTNAPLFVMILWVCVYALITHIYAQKNIQKILIYSAMILMLCVSLAYGILVQSSSYKARYTETVYAQRYAPLLTWLIQHTPAQSYVLAHNDISELIPIYTDNNVVWEHHASYYLMSKERREFTPEAIFSSKNIQEKISMYPVDYIIQDTQHLSFNFPKELRLKQIAQINDFIVYTLDY